MNELQRRKFELHANTEDYRRRVEQAVSWVHDVFDRFDNPCVNYSGGKDSLVLLHMVAESCGYDVDVYHFDNGLLAVPNSKSFVEESVERIGGELFIRTSEAMQDERAVLENKHGYRGFFGWYRRLTKERDWDIRLIGVRAAESGKRRDRFGKPPIVYDESFTVAAPIHQLSTRDVWSYIVSNGLSYHEVYDEQGELYGSMEHPRNRLVTVYDREFASAGSLEVSQFVFPSKTGRLKHIEHREE